MKGLITDVRRLGIQPSEVLGRRIVAAARRVCRSGRYAPNATDEDILKKERAINGRLGGIASIDAQAAAHGIQPSQVLAFNIIGAARRSGRYAPNATDEDILAAELRINGKASIAALGRRHGIEPSQVLDYLFVLHARRELGYQGTDAEVRRQARSAIAKKVLRKRARELGIDSSEVLLHDTVRKARERGMVGTDKDIIRRLSARNSRRGHARGDAAVSRKKQGQKKKKNDDKYLKGRAKMRAGAQNRKCTPPRSRRRQSKPSRALLEFLWFLLYCNI